jgi:hypothetical protein
MAEPIAVLALRRKRDQISGTIAHYGRLLREAQSDLAHVNAILRLFEATGEAGGLPPYMDLNCVLRRGETTKICMDALAKEGPLDTPPACHAGDPRQGAIGSGQGAGSDRGAAGRADPSDAS